MRLISVEFFAFLGVLLILYYCFPKRQRWVVLCLSSLVFYLSAGFISFIFILVISLSSYAFAFLLQARAKEGSASVQRGILTAAVLIILSLWLSVKLLSEGGGYLLPLGISFYSLRAISYLADIRRKRGVAERNFLKYFLYVGFFPLALLGPLVKFKDISEPLFSGAGASSEGFCSGLIRLSYGIFKKTVIANALFAPLSAIIHDTAKYSGVYVLFLLILYSAEIYCDFSGGIDMAIGISQMLGIRLPENFDRPFSSLTLREYWNRWHITLGCWFEEYVFYPLSLSKPMQRLSKASRGRFGVKIGRKIPVYIATALTWLLTGLWHGARANFIVWGLINGILVIISQEYAPISERNAARYPRIFGGRVLNRVNQVRVFLTVGAVRLLDLYGSVGVTFRMLCSIFYELDGYAGIFSGGLLDIIRPASLVTVLLSLAAVFFVGKKRIGSLDVAKRPFAAALCVFLLLSLSIVLGSYGAGFSAGEFIYSRY